MRNFLKSFIRDESGAAAAEYALILAIVGAGIAIAAKNLGTAISSAIDNAQSNVWFSGWERMRTDPVPSILSIPFPFETEAAISNGVTCVIS